MINCINNDINCDKMTYIFLIINSSASRTPTIFPAKFLVLSNGVSLVTENTHRSEESVEN